MPAQPLCLIVDTNPDHASEIALLCKERGFRVEHAVLATSQDHRSVSADEPHDSVERMTNDWLREINTTDVDVAFLDTTLGLAALTTLADGNLSGAELFAMADTDDSRVAEACIRAGYSHYFCKPFSTASLSPLLDDIANELRAQPTSDSAADPDCGLDQFGLMRGSSRSMRKLFRLLRKIAPTETTALIVGESGTGKELVAETIHALSERSEQPYLTLNCSALAENLVESELFGHEKGSFSGAHKRHLGFFERAHGGTLFLDEITEMQPDLQAKLLRALESGEVRRVGGVDPIEVDVRVIAATNRDPLLAVEEGQLREDLYYRLAHISVHVPPLRRRGGDIRGLALFFLMQLNEQHNTAITINEDTLAALEHYDWPGNVRQLRHAVERAYIVTEGEIQADAFALGRNDTGILPTGPSIPVSVGMSLAECEREIILANLEHNDGDKKITASVLGVSLKTLYNRLRDYGADETSEG